MRRFKTAFLFLFLSAPPLLGAETACPRFFYNALAPDLLENSLTNRTQALCYRDFALLHSGETAGPLWVAEHLTDEGMDAAGHVPRSKKGYFADTHLPDADRAEAQDYGYKRTGYQRGHMAPAGDMTSALASDESFTLANIVPQDCKLNGGIWEGIENNTRFLAETEKDIYVVTGPSYSKGRITFIGDRERLPVPDAIFKAVFIPSRNAAAAWWAPNDGSGQYQVISIADLSRRLRIDIFPPLADEIKQTAAQLPKPKSRKVSCDFTPAIDPGTTSAIPKK